MLPSSYISSLLVSVLWFCIWFSVSINARLNFGAKMVTFCIIHIGNRKIFLKHSPPPPWVPTSFPHILCTYENTLTCKMISWNSGGGGGEVGGWCFKNIFLFPLCMLQKVTILENQMQNHKIETNSELIYEDGSIWSTLIFIKIIGSDTLWFPLPPSEVLLWWAIIFVIKSHLELPEKISNVPIAFLVFDLIPMSCVFWLSNPHGIPPFWVWQYW